MTVARPRLILPPPLERMLLTCHEFENIIGGAHRRTAWRVTRAVIAALLAEGYPAAVIADRLGVTAGSVQTRGASSAVIDRASLAAVPGLGNPTFSSWLDAAAESSPYGANNPTVDLREYVALVESTTPLATGSRSRRKPTPGNVGSTGAANIFGIGRID